MKQDKTKYRKVNPEKLPPAEFLKKEVEKLMPRTEDLSGNERRILNSMFGINGHKVASVEELAEQYHIEAYKMIKIENKALAKVVGNIH